MVFMPNEQTQKGAARGTARRPTGGGNKALSVGRLAHTRRVCCVSETPTCRYLQHARVDILGGCRQGRKAIGVATFEHHALVEVVAYDVVGIVVPNQGSLVGIYALGGYINFAIRGI